MVKFNCLAKNINNALEVYKATNGNTLVGLTTKSFSTDEEAINTMNEWAKAIDNNVSIGLGGGDPKQCYMVTRVANKVFANHINQIFCEVAATKALTKNKDAIINALISPSKEAGKVVISTGPLSSHGKPAIVDVETAGNMAKEMGANSIKFFNMKNMDSDDELISVAKMCAKLNLTLELTGGLDLNNIENYIKISKDAGVKKLIPHVYSSIVDKETGLTKVKDVKKIWEIIKRYY